MSSHDEMETCRRCHVLHGDGPGHVCIEPSADAMADAQLNQALNDAGISVEAAKRNLLNKLASGVVRLNEENRAKETEIARLEGRRWRRTRLFTWTPSD